MHIKFQLRRLFVTAITMLLTLVVYAQTDALQEKMHYRITGQVISAVDYKAIPMASVQMFTKDSTFLRGAAADESGHFTLYTDHKADYQVVVSSLGYASQSRSFTVDSRTTLLGSIQLVSDSIMLDETVVVGNLPKMQIVEDTLIYNAGAFKVPEGSVLDELIEKLPGAEVTESGITINGKTIQKILVDGKEFFVGDMSTARKNLPVDIVDKLKVYDEKSDLAKVTGIDDGNDHTVIDVRIKKGMNMGYMLNGDAGYGTHSRYSDRLTATSFTERNKLAFVGNASNLANGRSTPGGRGGGGGGGQGLRTSQTLGLNYNYDDKGSNGRRESTLQMDGSVKWNHGTSDQQTTSMNENWEKVGARTYSNSKSSNLSTSHGWNADYRLEWRPDEQTNIQFRPSWSFSSSDRISSSQSMQFSADPYDYSDDPLDLYTNFIDTDSVRTNRHVSESVSHSESKKVGGSLQYNRKFGDMGRNLTLRVEGNYNDSKSTSLTNNNVHLYKVRDRQGNDSVYYTNRYNLTPSSNWNYAAQVTYSEPIIKNTFIQFNYKFSYSENESDRSTYDFSTLREQFGQGVVARYGGFDDYLGNVGGSIDGYLDHSLSKYGKYTNTNHDVQLLFRIIRTFYNFSTGLRWQPQRTHFIQNYRNISTDTIRNVSNFNPTMNLYIHFTRQHTLKIDYHGNSSQPSISDMIDITDDSNPLNITKGNPGLKPSFTNNLSVEWKDYLQATKTSLSANWNYSRTSNSVSRVVTYDDATGGRISQPQNINGNWNTSGAFRFNSALDEKAMWNISTSTSVNYRNAVSYVTVDRKSSSQENLTKNTSLGQSLTGSFRNDWLDVDLHGNLNYSHVRNMLQTSANRDTYSFSYGGSIQLQLPWNMTINTSLNENSRRGYSDATANTNELIWNAQISQSLLKRKALVLTLQFYDILGQQKTFSYNVGDTRISESHYNSITQYAMLHVIFNFRSFGGKAAREQRRSMRERPEGGTEGGEGFGPPGGGPGGRGGARGGFGGPGGGGRDRGGFGGM